MRLFVFIFFVLLLSIQAYSQGCSDAGVCSVGALGLTEYKYKYEKLPIDIIKLEEVEVEDTEIFGENFNPKRKKDTSDVQESIFENNNGIDQLPKVENVLSYDVDSVRKNDNRARAQVLKSPRCIFNYLISYGSGDNQTGVVSNNLEINYRILNKKLYAQLKLPYVFVSGDLGNTNGVGDLTLSMSYTAIRKKKRNLSVVAGMKIPTNNSDLAINNEPLPMAYQTSLGSRDALFGVNYGFNKWNVTFAYQHSFNSNNNGYLHSNLNSTAYNDYFESNQLKRADDGVFRVNRSFLFKKATITSGMLFIYHLQNDTYVDSDGKRKAIEGSQGLTLNLNLSTIYPVYKKLDFTFIVASPIVIRDARPDGLTRSFVVMGGLRYILK